MNQNLKQGGISIRTWLRSRLLVEVRACFLSFFFLLSAFCAFSHGVPVGSIVAWGTVYPPENWLLCDGAAYPITTYTNLYAVISTTFGGVTNEQGVCYKVPNLKQRFPLGWNPSIQRPIASYGGAESVTLTIAQMPAHDHNLSKWVNATGFGYASVALANHLGGGYQEWCPVNISDTGGGQSHENMSPYLVVNYIIKAVPDSVTTNSFFGDLEEIELWNLKVGLWIFGGTCAVVLSVCFFLRS